jgi:transcriptional regulator with XRE-family HTH domain
MEHEQYGMALLPSLKDDDSGVLKGTAAERPVPAAQWRIAAGATDGSVTTVSEQREAAARLTPGGYLKWLREQRGWTLRDVAEEMVRRDIPESRRVTNSYLSRMERNEPETRPARLLTLAQLYGGDERILLEKFGYPVGVIEQASLPQPASIEGNLLGSAMIETLRHLHKELPATEWHRFMRSWSGNARQLLRSQRTARRGGESAEVSA